MRSTGCGQRLKDAQKWVSCPRRFGWKCIGRAVAVITRDIRLTRREAAVCAQLFGQAGWHSLVPIWSSLLSYNKQVL